ncbi:MAG: hypothetical protein C0514_08165 [Candidatus Puniceispirillum sp.]|nr:hypothetical protein [Candidatus Puniceispirillum sp.]
MKQQPPSLDFLRSKIQAYLAGHAINLKAFERMTGLKYRSLSNIMYGQANRVSIFTYAKIAKVMGCTVEELMGKQDRVPPKDPLKVSVKDSPPIRDGKLLLGHLDLILRICKDHGVLLSPSQVCRMLEQSYLFTVKNEDKSPDRTFILWLLERVKVYGDI